MIDEQIDVFIFCATKDEHFELSNLLEEVSGRVEHRAVFDRQYTIRELKQDGHSIVACTSCLEEIGRLPAAIAARDLLYHFQTLPKDIVLCGIAAAHPDSGYQIGDIVVPVQIVDYAEQKHSEGTIQFRGLDYSIEGNRLFRLAKAMLATPWHERIGNQLRNAIERSIKRLRWPPIGYTDLTLACGDYVLDDKEMVEQILNELSETRRHKVRAIEMESTGIARSLNSVLAEGAQLTVIKSISDFAFGKTDSAQPGAQLIAAAFVRALLLSMMRIKGRKESAADPSDGNADIIASLSPRPEILRMLSAYPPELARAWRATAIDGAFEIFSCAQASNKYGGYRRSQILCEVLDVEWPVDFGGLNEVQLSGLETGIIGSRDGSGLGWLNSQRGTPNRIRVLLEPPEPAVLDRGTISLRLGNSDYFSVRTVTELSRRDFQGLKPNFGELFPERWAEPQHRFSNRCVPYHVSAQAVLIVRPDKRPDARYLLLASTNPAGLSIAQGWGATMAEQMWASGRSQRGEPWWEAPLSDRRLLYRQPETREGDPHINETLARGLREEFQINVDKDCYQEPLLLSVAIEQDMYFVTFIYFVEVKLALEDVYQRWNTAPDKQEMGLLAAYQLTGRCGDGTMMDGARRLAELVAVDEFDAGPHLLPSGVEDARLKRRWHVSSKLRMYACGMHLWPREFSRYVRISA